MDTDVLEALRADEPLRARVKGTAVAVGPDNVCLGWRMELNSCA
jgi:hypothetical protein